MGGCVVNVCAGLWVGVYVSVCLFIECVLVLVRVRACGSQTPPGSKEREKLPRAGAKPRGGALA
jgi:hypothetical protein